MDLLFLAPVCLVLVLLVAFILVFKMFVYDKEFPHMKEIASAICDEATAYLNRLYNIFRIFFLIVFFPLFELSISGHIANFVLNIFSLNQINKGDKSV